MKRGYGYKAGTKAQDGVTWTYAKFDTGLGEASFTDEFSEDVLASRKNRNITASLKRIGRGEGLYDMEGLKLFGDIDPSDVSQVIP